MFSIQEDVTRHKESVETLGHKWRYVGIIVKWRVPPVSNKFRFDYEYDLRDSSFWRQLLTSARDDANNWRQNDESRKSYS